MNQNWDEMSEHLILDVYDGYFEDLDSPNFLRDIFTRAILKSGMTILNEYTHKFDPYGVTVNLTLGESHLSCHTWPEKNCVAFDIFTCGAKNPRCVAFWVLEYFDTDDYVMKDYAR